MRLHLEPLQERRGTVRTWLLGQMHITQWVQGHVWADIQENAYLARSCRDTWRWLMGCGSVERSRSRSERHVQEPRVDCFYGDELLSLPGGGALLGDSHSLSWGNTKTNNNSPNQPLTSSISLHYHIWTHTSHLSIKLRYVTRWTEDVCCPTCT